MKWQEQFDRWWASTPSYRKIDVDKHSAKDGFNAAFEDYEYVIESLKQISNLLTHSRPEDYAEVINKCMMIADVAISDWEGEE